RLFALMIGGPLGSTLFPYTTLFRSGVDDGGCVVAVGGQVHHVGFLAVAVLGVLVAGAHQAATSSARVGWVCSSCWSLVVSAVCRSEEHTSELQSRENLVCRLLLEKK